MKKVAVYGSLLAGLGNHRLLADSTFLMEAEVAIPFKMIDLGAFPGLIPAEENQDIKVEIYEVTDEVFDTLDGLEGYPSFYDRTTITPVEGHENVWIYFLNKADRYYKDPIESGDWKAHLKLKYADRDVLSKY
jgi:gamma-glutamylcyclotransferase (GGCT)/AIG2-like uncharacterized protein YtfP